MTTINYSSTNNSGAAYKASPELSKQAHKEKPKKSSLYKLDKLLKTNPIPNTFASAILQLSKRYLAGNTPANELEAVSFQYLAKLPPENKRLLNETLRAVDALPKKIQAALFDMAILTADEGAIEPETLMKALVDEITAIVNQNISTDSYCSDAEKAGLVRLVPNSASDDMFPNQIHVCRINNLRTNDFLPRLDERDYVPAELQENEPFLGNRVGASCLRVVQATVGEIIYLEGINFFNTEAFVRLSPVANVGTAREVTTWVCGDTKTPRTEIINGQTVVIADSRVQDRIRFAIPVDLSDGVYRLEVVVPNNSGIQGSSMGTILTSNSQYLQVLANDTARYNITNEEIWCQKETSPGWWGSDEIGLRTESYMYTGSEFSDQTLKTYKRLGDVDTNERRTLNQTLYESTDGMLGISLIIIGYEVDSEDQYKSMYQQLESVSNGIMQVLAGGLGLGFLAYIAAAAISGGVTGAGGATLFGITLFSFSLPVVPVAMLVVCSLIAIAVIYEGASNLISTIWGPADIVIDDRITLTRQDFVELTDMRIPAPPIYPELPAYTTYKGIEVRRISSVKNSTGYIEERKYLSNDEESAYVIRLKYTRLN